ncbi:MAG: hypothetical protein QXX20_02920 [Candidatus Thermoplasmatota archaeon]
MIFSHRTLLVVTVCLFIVFGTSVTISEKTQEKKPPSPPSQPPAGPGGSEYNHGDVKIQRYGFGAQQFWIFEPADPTPLSAPLIVFNHGWSAFVPFFYQGWINHVVKRGNIVVFPRYQRGFLFGFQHFSANALEAVKNAIKELSQGNHVIPELEHFAIVGHSLGGSITADIAALAESEGLPIPKAIMAVQPVIPRANLSLISSNTILLVVVGQDDTMVGDYGGKRIFLKTNQIPLDHKDFIIQVTDMYGEPDLIADHFAPVSPKSNLGRYGKVDAMDYYSTWKLFDGLIEYAFYGIHKEYCLGNTPEQRFMGCWSDGTPVKELIVTDFPE